MFNPVTMGGIPAHPYAMCTPSPELALRRPQPYVGLEIEAEFDTAVFRTPDAARIEDSGNWSRVADHSLRSHGQYQGWEYVSCPTLSQPTMLTELLAELEPVMQGRFNTPRAGVHIHVNCKPLVAPEFLAGLFAYYMLEPMIYDYVGGGREQNIFCVPLREEVTAAATLSQEVARVMLSDTRMPVVSEWHPQVNLAIQQAPKYLGLGLRTLNAHGTVESRHMVTPSGSDWAVQVRNMARVMAKLFAPSTAHLESEEQLLYSVLSRMFDAAKLMRATIVSDGHDRPVSRYRRAVALRDGLYGAMRDDEMQHVTLEGWLDGLQRQAQMTEVAEPLLAGAPLLIDTLSFIHNQRGN